MMPQEEYEPEIVVELLRIDDEEAEATFISITDMISWLEQ